MKTQNLEVTRNPYGFVNQYDGEQYLGVSKPGLVILTKKNS